MATMKGGLAWALLAAVLSLSPRPAAAQDASPKPSGLAGQADEIHGIIDDLRDSVADTAVSDEKIHHRAYEVFNQGIPASKISVRANLHGWDRETQITGNPADVNEMLDSSQRRLNDLHAVPPPDLSDSRGWAQSMNDGTRMKFSSELDSREMGEYQYQAKSGVLGTIRLNSVLSDIAAVVGNVFAYATIVHEASHARDHQHGALKPDDVIEGEILAFQTQYLWLKLVDPYGERLSLIRSILSLQLQQHPSDFLQTALNYATALHVLEGTGGDKEKVRDYVEHLGYREHQQQAKPLSTPSA